MTEPNIAPAALAAIGIVSADLAESARFYRLLGLDVPDAGPGEDHVEVTTAGGVRIMWDSVDLVQRLDPHWTEPAGGHRLGLAFQCGDPAGVDALHRSMVDAGFASKTEPWDAFWGQRYAQVVDPDGNVVDLFAPLG